MPGSGYLLREARERLGKSLSEAARDTRLKPACVEAMENDDYRRLDAPVYARGFYRIYCHWLQLDPEPFVAEYLDAVSGPSARKNGARGGLFSVFHRKREKEAAAKAAAEQREKARQHAAETAPAEPVGSDDIPPMPPPEELFPEPAPASPADDEDDLRARAEARWNEMQGESGDDSSPDPDSEPGTEPAPQPASDLE